MKHYYNNYDNVLRFISYFYQIDLAKGLNSRKILEIGVGNKTVSNYLKQHGFDVTTCDFNKKLEPDYVAEVRSLPFKDNSYDTILVCEVLEHIPWKDVKKALNELYRVAKRSVILSVPYSTLSFELVIKLPLIRRIIRKPFVNLLLRIPYFFRSHRFDGQHYWEMGRKNYSIRKIRKMFMGRFKIVKEVRPLLNSYHHFFVLEKR